MGFRIANNIASMNVQRQLTVSDNNLTKSLERLSSGFRINSAADDAAGLALSQTMRADIASFKVASRNATEANSLLQTAEGAMDQIGNMLVRLKELATQAASANTGTNRAQIDEEKTKLTAEIERIASVTAYSGSTLLDGTFGSISGALAGGTATSTNSYAVNSDMSQKFTFTDVGNTMYAETLGAVADTANTAHLLDGSNLYRIIGQSEQVSITTTALPGLAEGTYVLTTGSGATTVSLVNATSGTTVSVATITDGTGTLTFSEVGLELLIGDGVGNTTSFAAATLSFVDTGLVGTSWSTDGSVDASTANTLTVTANTANTITLTDEHAVTYSGVVSGNQASFASLGLTIDLVSGDYFENADDLVGLQLTQGAETATSTSTITITSSKTALTTGTYAIDKVGSGNTISIGNGTFTEYVAITGSSKTVTFSELGITMVGAANLTADVLGNDSLVVADTGVSALTVTDSTTTGTYTITDTAGSITVTHSGGTSQTESGSAGNVVDFDQLGIKITLGSDYVAGALDDLSVSVSQSSSKTFQLGTENTADNQISISLTDVTLSGLGLSSIDLSTAAGALAALTTIDTAISTHSTARGSIGAFMNRLSYASANLATTVQNMQAAESVIRDADMASEMTEFTKAQILMQAGTAMLTQANMAPQMVLSLFG